MAASASKVPLPHMGSSTTSPGDVIIGQRAQLVAVLLLQETHVFMCVCLAISAVCILCMYVYIYICV